MRYFWLLPIIGAILAVLTVLLTLVSSKGAPQEAAGFSLACALAIIPYVFAKAAQELGGENRADSTKRIVDAIDAKSRL